MALSLTINGVTRTIKPRTLRMTGYVNNRRTLRCGVLSTDGSYRPTMDQVVVLSDGATVIFTGTIRAMDEAGLTLKSGIVTSITCADYTALCDQRLVKASTTGGITARDAADYIVTNYLSAYGITRDAGMAAGGTLGELSYDYAKVTDVFNDIMRLAAAPGWVWYVDDNKVLKAFQPGIGNWACPFSLSAGSNSFGDITVTPSRERYANKVILTYNDGTSVPASVSVQDNTEIALYGIWEKAFSVTTVIDSTAATALANSFLSASLVVPKLVKFQTRTAGARPGQTISINIPLRNLNNNFLITEMETWDEDGINVVYRVSCIEGSKIAPSWLDTYRSWSGTGSGVAAVGGGGVITVVGRAAYPLGGSALDSITGTAGTAYLAPSAIPVQLDTTALGPATVTAVITCKAGTAGVQVTPEIWNVSDNVQVGVGSAVTGTTWTTVIFTITPTAGQKYYQLKLNPNTTGAAVYGQGYLEVGR